MPASELAARPAGRESSACADETIQHLVDEDRRRAERRIAASSLAGIVGSNLGYPKYFDVDKLMARG